MGVENHQCTGVVGAKQLACSELPAGRTDRQASHARDVGAISPEAIAVERHGLHADDAPIADVHLHLSAAIEVAQPHVGDAGVGVMQGVFGIVGQQSPVFIVNMAALLRDQKRDEVAMSIAADCRAQAADDLIFRQFERVYRDQLAVQPDFGHRRAVLDHQQPFGSFRPVEDEDIAGHLQVGAFPRRRELAACAARCVRAILAFRSVSSLTTTASPV